MNKLQNKFHSFYLNENGKIGKENWRFESELVAANEVQEIISNAIIENKPFSAGKIGSNEQILIQWAYQIPINLNTLGKIAPFYFQTLPCLTNAGAKPRTKEEYKIIGGLFYDALQRIDLLPVFKLAGEKSIIKTFELKAQTCGHLDFLPFKQVASESWAKSLSGKKIIVVSPFKEEILKQSKIMKLIWGNHSIMPEDFKIEVIKFPYLIDRKNDLHWQEVYNDIKLKLTMSDADVGLFGCGFMGMLFADVMKVQGKVGIHLGGALQFLFGVKGKRYEEQHWFAQYINEHWIRPGLSNKPSGSNNIENGCYW